MQNVVRIFVMLVGVVLLLGNFGISIAPMLTTLGIGGLAVALGLQETLANVFAGMQLTIARQIRVGDVLRLAAANKEMILEDIGWRATRMRCVFSHTTVIVPNAKLAQDVITNYDLPTPEIGVLVDVGVHYESDLEKVERVVCEVGREVMLEVPGGVATHHPHARYVNFAESSINLVVHLRAAGLVESMLVRHEFIKRLAARFRAEHIVIPYPIRAINLSQERAGVAGLVEARPSDRLAAPSGRAE